MANLSLVFDILARDQASPTFRKVGDEGERAGNKLAGAARGVDGVVGSLKAGAAALAGAAIVSGFASLYGAAAESQRIGRLTESTIKATGGAAQITAAQVGDLAGAISAKTGIDDEAIQSGQNLLLTFKNVRNEVGAGNDIFNQASTVLADMSTVLGTDASGSAIQLGKALNDPVKGISTLSRAGVQFTEQQKEQIRTLVESGDTLGAQKIILGELTAQFGGAAEAAATPLDKMKVSVGNIAEAIGGGLIPVVDRLATGGLTAIHGISAGFSDGETSADGFEGAMQDVGVALGQVADFGGGVVSVGRDILGFFDAIPGPVIVGVAAIAGFSALKGPVVDSLETIYIKALLARDGLAAAGGGMGVLKGGASGLLGVLGGPWGIAVGAATVGLGFLVDGLSDSKDVAEDAGVAQRTFADAVRETNGAIDESVRAAAAKAAQDAGLLDIADDLGLSLPQVTDAVLGNRDAYNELVSAANAYYDESLTYENAGDLGMTENAARVDDFIAGLDVLRPTVAETRQEQEALAGATAQTGTALGEAVPTAEDFTASMEDVATQVSDAKKEVDAYKLSLDILTGGTVSLIEVQSAYYASMEFSAETLSGLEGAVADANGELNRQSEAGRFAADTLLGVRDSGNQLISTMIQQGQTADQVRAQDAALRESFIATAEEMGFTSGQAEGLANQILGIPAEREVEITADVAAAQADLAGVQTSINGLTGRDIAVRVSSFFGFGGLPENRDGGPIRGPGTSRSDSILGIDAFSGVPTSWVSNDEFVTNAPAYARNRALVEAINAGTVPAGINPADLRRLADGGPVVTINVPSRQSMVDDVANTITESRALEPATGLVAALQYAQSQAGKPYVWGSAGPGGFDCSGFMSAITNVARGRSPNSRLGATSSFPWSGFVSGDGLFTIGSTPNAGGGIGHMAGTLLGVNVESRGGQGVVVGRSARGARDRIFTERAHLATYDTGGTLQPGYTLAYNGTGQEETIRTAEQEAELSRTGRSTVINIQVDRDAERIARATRQAQADEDWLAGRRG